MLASTDEPEVLQIMIDEGGPKPGECVHSQSRRSRIITLPIVYPIHTVMKKQNERS